VQLDHAARTLNQRNRGVRSGEQFLLDHPLEFSRAVAVIWRGPFLGQREGLEAVDRRL
jgi:hypothetical protein